MLVYVGKCIIIIQVKRLFISFLTYIICCLHERASVSNAVRHGLILEGVDDSNLLSLILLSGDGGPSVFDLYMIGESSSVALS